MSWAKILELACDTDICDSTLMAEGNAATITKLTAYARSQGWKFRRSGYATCQECNYTGQDLIALNPAPKPVGTLTAQRVSSHTHRSL
jgi:hypothetical protein